MENLPPAVDPPPPWGPQPWPSRRRSAAQQHSQRHRCRGNAPKCVGLRMSWNSLVFSTVGLVAGPKKNFTFRGINQELRSKEVEESNFRQYGEMKKPSAGRRVRREKIRRKKMQVREKVGKSRNTVFFRGYVAPEGWKVGSLKRRVRRHLWRWEMKSCTPLWREADFEVKRHKTPQHRTTFGSWDVEKCAALWREADLEVKCVKNWEVRSSFGSWDDEKVHGVVARSTFGSNKC